MSDMQEFPENIMDFINAYSFKDRKQIYTKLKEMEKDNAR